MLDIHSISVVLVSKDGYYVGKEGQLPKRFKGDKEFITNLVRDRVVLMSQNTLAGIPESIRKSAKEITTDENSSYDVNFGIGTFKQTSDMFIIIQSEEDLNGGKEFHFNRIDQDYELIMDMNNIRIFFKRKIKKILQIEKN